MEEQERRRYTRIKITFPIGIVVKDLGGRFFAGTITNIGGGGAGIVINTFLPVATQVSLTFEFQDGFKFENIEGKITRSTEQEDKFYSAIDFSGTSPEIKEKIAQYIKSIVCLRKIKPLKQLTDEESWYIRKISKETFYKEGQRIFDEGLEGEAFYIILTGKVRIVKKSFQKEEILALIREGEFFGEMALLDDSKRSASAIAFTNVEMFVIKKDDFRALLNANDTLAVKLLWVFIKTLSSRMRDIDKKMADSFFMDSRPLSDTGDQWTVK